MVGVHGSRLSTDTECRRWGVAIRVLWMDQCIAESRQRKGEEILDSEFGKMVPEHCIVLVRTVRSY